MAEKKDPAMLTLLHKDVAKALENEAFYSHIVTLDIDGSSEDVILKDVQRHPAKKQILHLDFFRVNKTTKLQTKVPLHFINEDSSIGVKNRRWYCCAYDDRTSTLCVCQKIYLNISKLIWQILILARLFTSQTLNLPKGVESVALSHGSDHDLSVATINKPKAAPS